jgi:hypothetical protein
MEVEWVGSIFGANALRIGIRNDVLWYCMVGWTREMHLRLPKSTYSYFGPNKGERLVVSSDLDLRIGLVVVQCTRSTGHIGLLRSARDLLVRETYTNSTFDGQDEIVSVCIRVRAISRRRRRSVAWHGRIQ